MDKDITLADLPSIEGAPIPAMDFQSFGKLIAYYYGKHKEGLTVNYRGGHFSLRYPNDTSIIQHAIQSSSSPRIADRLIIEGLMTKEETTDFFKCRYTLYPGKIADYVNSKRWVTILKKDTRGILIAAITTLVVSPLAIIVNNYITSGKDKAAIERLSERVKALEQQPTTRP